MIARYFAFLVVKTFGHWMLHAFVGAIAFLVAWIWLGVRKEVLWWAWTVCLGIAEYYVFLGLREGYRKSQEAMSQQLWNEFHQRGRS